MAHSRSTRLEREAANDGLEIRAQVAPRPVGMFYGLDLSFHPFAFHPSYKAIAHLPLAERVARMKDPHFRAQLLSRAARGHQSRST
jgi:N-acyl-D-amino-acid deacylase